MESPVFVGVRKAKFRWDYAGEVDYRKKDGTYIKLALWRGHCRKCHALFGIKVPVDCESPKDNSNFSLRNCEQHRDKAKSAAARKAFAVLLARNSEKIKP